MVRVRVRVRSTFQRVNIVFEISRQISSKNISSTKTSSNSKLEVKLDSTKFETHLQHEECITLLGKDCTELQYSSRYQQRDYKVVCHD